MLIFESGYKNAVNQFGKELADRFARHDPSPDKKYTPLMCRLFKDENEHYSVYKITNLIQRYNHVRNYMTDKEKDFRNMSYYEILNLTEKYESSIGLTPIYHEEHILIYRPINFEQSKQLGVYQWCTSYNKNWWDQHYEYNDETIYIIYNLFGDTTSHTDKICVTVNKSGTRKYYLSDNHLVANNHYKMDNDGKYIYSEYITIDEVEKMLGNKVIAQLIYIPKNTNDKSVTESLYHQYELMYKLGCIPQNLFEGMIREDREIYQGVWQIDRFRDGYAVIKDRPKQKYNFINLEDELLSDDWFDYAIGFYNGLGRILIRNKGWNFIDVEGDYLLDQWFGYVDAFDNNGLAIVMKNNKWNFIDRNGEILCDQWFDKIEPFKDKRAVVELNGKENFIDEQGDIVSEQWYDSIIYLGNGFWACYKARKGYKVDRNGFVIRSM